MPTNNKVWLRDFLQKLVPAQEFAALEITEKSARYLLFSRSDLTPRQFGEIKLEPGTIEKGELKNKAKLVKALEELKAQVHCDASAQRCSPVIVSLSSVIFFLGLLELPEIPETSYEEAVRLNAAQISPINLDESYFDWQNLGVNLGTFQREFLVGVAARSKIDAYLDVFNQVGLQPLALESRSLSLLRNFNYFSQTIEKNIALLLVEIGEDGISFLVGKSGRLLFDSFIFWGQLPEAADGKITQADLEAVLAREVGRVLEYFASHGQEQVVNFALISSILKKELVTFLVRRFNLREVPIILPVVNPGKAPDLYAGLVGAALRGSLIPRHLDDILSFLPQGTEEFYRKSQLSSFVSLWAKISTAVFASLGLVMFLVLLLVNSQKKQVQLTLASLVSLPEAAEMTTLTQQAEEFNRLVSEVKTIEAGSRNWSEVLAALVQVTQELKLSLNRVSFAETSREFRLRAVAPNQETAMIFPEKLKQFNQLFAEVEIPLSSFSQTPQGVGFEAVIRLR